MSKGGDGEIKSITLRMPGVPPDFLLIGADYRNSSINPSPGGEGAYLISSLKEGSLLEVGRGLTTEGGGGGGGLIETLLLRQINKTEQKIV